MSTTFSIEIAPDYDTKPEEFDCYSPEDVAAYHNDEWRYVGIRVKAAVSEFSYDLNVTTNGLWGVEYGSYFEHNEAYIRDMAAEQWAEVPAEVRAQLGELPADATLRETL
jgi:hypothetical protein